MQQSSACRHYQQQLALLESSQATTVQAQHRSEAEAAALQQQLGKLTDELLQSDKELQHAKSQVRAAQAEAQVCATRAGMR